MPAEYTLLPGTESALRGVRRAYIRLFGRHGRMGMDECAELTGQAASHVIRAGLGGEAPFMAARLGRVELECLLTVEAIHRRAPFARKVIDFVIGHAEAAWWQGPTRTSMSRNAGFYPAEPAYLERFWARMLHDMPEVDVLGSWLPGEKHFSHVLGSVTTVPLRDLEPYYHADPWTTALEGRTVLVVHPFSETIEAQYARRLDLFADHRVLPEFDLRTLKAVQSLGDGDRRFSDWFDALSWMEDAIAAAEFEIAVVGCGAYGFPLAAHVKRLGRKAVHLGGATQILFGIKGRRWDDHPTISRLYNEYWVRPRDEERPPAYLDVEGGCYW
jgi:hypothetical protein